MPWKEIRQRKPFRDRAINAISTLVIIAAAVIALWGMAQEVMLLMGIEVGR